MKIIESPQLDTQFGIAGSSQMQVVGGPICVGIMVVLITS